MSSTYTKHYQDSLDRKIENNDVVRRLLIVDNNLANISQGVNALGTSNATANAISPIYADTQNIRNNQLPNLGSSIAAVNNQVAMVIGGQSNQATFNQVNAIVQQIPTLATGNQVNQQAIVIGGVRTDVANLQNRVDAVRAESANIPRNIYNAQLSSIQNGINTIPTNVYNAQLTALQSSVNNIPTYNGSNAIANVQSSLSSQAILIGGIPTNTYNASISNVQTQSDNIASQVGQIPRLIYSSNFSAVGNQLSAIQTTDNSIQNRVNSIPNGTYNAQLNAIQATGNATRTESQNIPRATYNSSFATVNTKLDNISTQISGISSSGGSGASSVVALNLTSLIVPFNVNNAALDLLWCLGAGDLGYVNPNPSRVTVSASSSVQGLLTDLTGRNNSDWASNNVANQWVMFDFGFSSSIRKAMIKTIGLQGRSNLDTIWATLLIEGSNDLTTWITLLNWNTGGHDSLQWKYTSFTNNIFYRYLRINQLALNASGNDYLGLSEIRLYGAIDNP